MTWYAIKDHLDRRIAEIMAADGFEARPFWLGRKGAIRCGVPGHQAWHFEVNIELDLNGGIRVNVESTYDTLRRGKLIDIEIQEPVPERKFAFKASDTAGTGRFFNELGKETKRWASRRAAYEQRESMGGIADHLRDLIDRDPENAAQAIADMLNKHLAPYEVEALQESIVEANTVSPAP